MPRKIHMMFTGTYKHFQTYRLLCDDKAIFIGSNLDRIAGCNPNQQIILGNEYDPEIYRYAQWCNMTIYTYDYVLVQQLRLIHN